MESPGSVVYIFARLEKLKWLKLAIVFEEDAVEGSISLIPIKKV
jgi:hypothetical protein